MIASFTNDFIFIKTQKTGGTSVEIVLSSWCSGKDICTPISEEEERAPFGGRAMNYKSWLGKQRFYNHMPASEVKELLSGFWDRAYKFTIERDPFEKVVSRAWFALSRRNGPASEIGKEIDAVIRSRMYINYPLYSIGGALAVDEVISYDNLWPRIGELAKRFGKAIPPKLPQAKAGIRADRRPAIEVLTDAQKEIILRDAAEEIAVLRFARRPAPTAAP